MNINPMLMTDFYKISHRIMSEKGTEKIYSTFTPRGSRIEGIDEIVFFGLQGFIKEYLIDYFNDNFFNKNKQEVILEYKRIVKFCIGDNCADTKHIEDLHDLGYLPIKIKAVNEGTLIPIRVPMMTIENTNKDFYWLTNFLETLISSEMWKPLTSATIVKSYKDLCVKYANMTCDSTEHIQWQCHNFSYRGMSGNDDAIKCGAGHLLFFSGTDTIPSICYLEKYYNCNVENELVGGSVLATEHSVQCGYQDDEKYINRMLDIVPEGILSVVSDGYDYWNVLENVLSKVKDRILNRNGKYVTRPDTGVPEDIICGTKRVIDCDILSVEFKSISDVLKYIRTNIINYYDGKAEQKTFYFKYDNITYSFIVDFIFDFHDGKRYIVDYNIHSMIECVLNSEEKGSIQLLWDLFGGTINSKGYKVLDPHVGLIYGDAITPKTTKEIFERLKYDGFASENIVLGVGSFSLGYVTRDTFAMAIKATYTVIDGKEVQIFKNPKTGNGVKKSAKGKVAVYKVDGKIKYIDCLNKKNEVEFKDNLLEDVFIDGKLLKDCSFADIKNKLNK